jgi:hypothetical protein
MKSSGSGQGSAADFCEHGNEPSNSIKGGEFLEKLSDCQFPKKGPAP